MPSASSSLTTIFDGNSEPRYEELRAERKFISKIIKKFQQSWRKFKAVTEKEFDDDIHLFDEAQDVDTMRLDIAANIRSWIAKAHENLDINADVDRTMLSRMSNYVERVRRCILSNPFIIEKSDEMQNSALDLPIPSVVLPLKNHLPHLLLPNLHEKECKHLK